jgi:1-pyrroline-5-carboxylate dehydrogenase
MELMRNAASGRYPRPVIAEMGGKNPAYVSKSADIEAAARGVAKSAFGGAGQKCTCCSVAYIHSSLYDRFVDALKAEAAKLKVGNSIVDREANVGPLINDAAVSRYVEAVEHARKHGRLVTGGSRITASSAAQGRFVEPTIVDGLAPDDVLVSKELFAPFLVLQQFDELEEAIGRGNRVVYGLSAGFYGADPADRETFLNKAEAGIMYLNRPHGATTGGWPGIQTLTGWKGSGSSGKGALGDHFLPQFMRQQCRTIRET